MLVAIIQTILIVLGAIAFLAFPIWLIGPIYDRGWHKFSATPFIYSAVLSLYLLGGFGILYLILW